MAASPTTDDEGSQSVGRARLSSTSSSRSSDLVGRAFAEGGELREGAVARQVVGAPPVGGGEGVAQPAHLEVARGAGADGEGGVAVGPVGRDDHGGVAAHLRRIPARIERRVVHDADRAAHRVLGEERVEDHAVERTAGEGEGFRTDRREQEWRGRDIGALGEAELRELARGAGVRHGLTGPQPAQDVGGVAERGERRRGHAVLPPAPRRRSPEARARTARR